MNKYEFKPRQSNFENLKFNYTMLTKALQAWLILASSLYGNSMFAQSLPNSPVLEKLYGKSGQDLISDLAEDSQGRVVAVGTSSKGIYGGEDVYLLLLNQQLELTYEKYIGRSSDDGVHKVKIAPDGRYMLMGYSTMPVSKSSSKELYKGGRDGWLLLLNTEGHIEKELIIGTTLNDELIQAFPLSNGDFLLIANTGDQTWLLRINSSGTIIWEKKLRYHGLRTHTKDAVLASNGQLFLAGSVTEDKTSQMWLACFEPNGNKVWEKTTPTNVVAEAVSMIETKSGRLGIAGYANDLEYRENGVYKEFEFNGEPISSPSLGGREDDRFFDVKQLHNGRIVLTGRSKSFERGSRRDRAWSVVLDRDGSVKEEEFYGSKATDATYAVLQRNDGSIVAAGLSSQNILKSSQAWVMQLTKPYDVARPQEKL